MAGSQALAAAGASIRQLLQRALAAEFPGGLGGVGGVVPQAVLVRTQDLEGAQPNIQRPGVSLFVHRVDFDKVTRAAFATNTLPDGTPYLPLEMRFLLTPWADNVEDELKVLGAAMLAFEATPILGPDVLDGSGQWELDESLQIVLEDISTEAIMRMFDSLPVDYHLSVAYIARLVRIAVPATAAGLTTSQRHDTLSSIPGRTRR